MLFDFHETSYNGILGLGEARGRQTGSGSPRGKTRTGISDALTILELSPFSVLTVINFPVFLFLRGPAAIPLERGALSSATERCRPGPQTLCLHDSPP